MATAARTLTDAEFKVGLRYVTAYVEQQQREHEAMAAQIASLRVEIRVLRGYLMSLEAMALRLAGHRLMAGICREALLRSVDGDVINNI